jgi:hypothetical protein
MPVYTVHEPQQRNNDVLAHTARIAFVRDGFHFWAFLFGPLWLLRHRMWLEFITYLIIVGGITFAIARLGVTDSAGAIVAFLIAILLGMEAPSLRRWKLARRGFDYRGVIVGEDRDHAERRFFDGWIAQDHTPVPPPPAPASPFGRPPAGNDVVGLFPQPEARS